jgi:hypothetical protein
MRPASGIEFTRRGSPLTHFPSWPSVLRRSAPGCEPWQSHRSNSPRSRQSPPPSGVAQERRFEQAKHLAGGMFVGKVLGSERFGMGIEARTKNTNKREPRLKMKMYQFLGWRVYLLNRARSCLTDRSTRTPTLAMASPFYWPVLVPCGLTASGAG